MPAVPRVSPETFPNPRRYPQKPELSGNATSSRSAGTTSSCVACFPVLAWRGKQQRAPARIEKHRGSQSNLDGRALLPLFRNNFSQSEAASAGRTPPPDKANTAVHVVCRSSRPAPSWPRSNRWAIVGSSSASADCCKLCHRPFSRRSPWIASRRASTRATFPSSTACFAPNAMLRIAAAV